jgi:hypothetical protein
VRCISISGAKSGSNNVSGINGKHETLVETTTHQTCDHIYSREEKRMRDTCEKLVESPCLSANFHIPLG